MSSIRTNHLPGLPFESTDALASKKLANAAINEPKCNKPEGEGAKRPR